MKYIIAKLGICHDITKIETSDQFAELWGATTFTIKHNIQKQ